MDGTFMKTKKRDQLRPSSRPFAFASAASDAFVGCAARAASVAAQDASVSASDASAAAWVASVAASDASAAAWVASDAASDASVAAWVEWFERVEWFEPAVWVVWVARAQVYAVRPAGKSGATSRAHWRATNPTKVPRRALAPYATAHHRHLP